MRRVQNHEMEQNMGQNSDQPIILQVLPFNVDPMGENSHVANVHGKNKDFLLKEMSLVKHLVTDVY